MPSLLYPIPPVHDNGAIRSYSLDSAVELNFGNGLVDNYVLVGADGHVSAGVELDGFLSVDMAETLLLLVVRDLDRRGITHCWSSGWEESTTLLGRKSEWGT
jgi:hypothetical protein